MAAVHHPGGCYTLVVAEESSPSSVHRPPLPQADAPPTQNQLRPCVCVCVCVYAGVCVCVCVCVCQTLGLTRLMTDLKPESSAASANRRGRQHS
ncbi:hypothetical protein COCON_G00071790 [Conger conger]|uniref:Uncharacterized protein n=1 Tax=Conger conger TaxID=82655 RepID=A0A9Q1DMS6_CONCO|nr:hypothetical protein COCON_G00071790 [Conger conger]